MEGDRDIPLITNYQIRNYTFDYGLPTLDTNAVMTHLRQAPLSMTALPLLIEREALLSPTCVVSEDIPMTDVFQRTDPSLTVPLAPNDAHSFDEIPTIIISNGAHSIASCDTCMNPISVYEQQRNSEHLEELERVVDMQLTPNVDPTETPSGDAYRDWVRLGMDGVKSFIIELDKLNKYLAKIMCNIHALNSLYTRGSIGDIKYYIKQLRNALNAEYLLKLGSEVAARRIIRLTDDVYASFMKSKVLGKYDCVCSYIYKNVHCDLLPAMRNMQYLENL